jgi:hypothetical protein
MENTLSPCGIARPIMRVSVDALKDMTMEVINERVKEEAFA